MDTTTTDKRAEEMFKAGVQFGSSRTRLHPKMKKFIHGSRNGIQIFDVELIAQQLDKAKEFLKKLGQEKKSVLFVGTKPELGFLIESSSKDLNMPYVKERWLGGVLTNFETIKKQTAELVSLEQKKASGELEKYTKKERALLDKKMENLRRFFSGLVVMNKIPDAMFVIDSKEEEIAVREAKEVGIPVVAVTGADCDPDLVDYPVPANDSSLSSVSYLMKELLSSFKEGLAA